MQVWEGDEANHLGNTMLKRMLVICVLSALQGLANAWSQEPPNRKEPTIRDPAAYLGQTPPGQTPIVFAPGIVSLQGRCETYPTFSPDGKEMFFSVVNGAWTEGAIFQTKVKDGVWTTPERAPFSSSQSINWESFVSPDGKRMFFASSRPPSSASDMDIWVTERTSDSAWSDPVRLPSPINSNANDGSACVTGDGTLYFHSGRSGDVGGSELYRSRRMGDSYLQVENLGSVIKTGPKESEPYVAPDESYLTFISQTRTGGKGGWDLWICFRNKDGSWTQPINMGSEINTLDDEYGPRVTPDGKYLFFTRENRGKTMDIYWVSTSGFEKLRKQTCATPPPAGSDAAGK
jgi:Tol biopolymer transport system component